MARVTKDPELRREELIDTAEGLFARKGYEETSIADIVKKAKVAQGTFYYYFKSKGDILDAIAERYIRHMSALWKEGVSKEEMNAIQKMIWVNARLVQFLRHRTKLLAYMHEDSNALLHVRMERRSTAAVFPFMKQIIDQGIEEGLFHTRYPEEVALVLMRLAGVLESGPGPSVYEGPDALERIRDTAYDLFERVLGTERGAFAKYLKKPM